MDYGVTIQRALWPVAWRAEVRHLTPQENRGKANVFIDAFDENNQRMKDFYAVYRRSAGASNEFVKLDKPDSPMELGHGNIPIYPHDTLEVWVMSYFGNDSSDTVEGIHTRHPDEKGPNGEIWNSYGHHSFKVTFRRTVGEAPPVVVPALTMEERMVRLEKIHGL